MLNFRELIVTLVPPWLRRGNAAGLLYAIALHFDALVDLVTAAIKLRLPGVYSYETLPHLSRERRIRRGIGESDASLATRQANYLEAHKDRGGPYPMLEQVRAHYATAPFVVHLVYASGARFDMDAAGTVTRDAVSFVTGLGSEEWAHWWLVYEWPVEIASDGLWDDGADSWDAPPGVWDSALTVAEVTDFRLIPTEWNNAHCKGHLVVLAPGQALWDVPVESWGATVETWDGGSVDPVTLEIE